MNQFEARLEIKRKLENELISFVDVERIKGYGEFNEALKNSDDDYFYALRDEWIEELNDRLPNTLDIYGYAKGLEFALALGYWNWEGKRDNGINIVNGEMLGYYACKDYVYEEGLIYDVVDEGFKKYFGIDLTNLEGHFNNNK